MHLFAVPTVAAFTRGPASVEHFRSAVERVANEPERRLLIVERDGLPLGGANYHVVDGWLFDIGFIGFEEQRTGAGLFTMQTLLRIAFDELRVHRAFLEVVATNTAARRLYEKVGFTCEGRYVDGYRAGDGTFHDLLPYGMISPHASTAPALRSGV